MAPRKIQPYSYRGDPLVPIFPDDKPIIVFDDCTLCLGWAKLFISTMFYANIKNKVSLTPVCNIR